MTAQLSADASSAGDGDPVYIKVSTPQIPAGSPRSETYNPFIAYQDGANVELFSADGTYGTVDVYLFSTAGDLVSTTFDTSTGSILLPISGLSGSYTIIITVPGGTTFEGQFVIL